MPLAVGDTELEPEPDADWVRVGGGLTVEVAVADKVVDGLPDGVRVSAADPVTEPVDDPVELADPEPAVLELADADSVAVVLAVVLPLGEAVDVGVASGVPLLETDTELEVELEVDWVTDSGGLPLEVAVADGDCDALILAVRDATGVVDGVAVSELVLEEVVLPLALPEAGLEGELVPLVVPLWLDEELGVCESSDELLEVGESELDAEAEGLWLKVAGGLPVDDGVTDSEAEELLLGD